MENTIKIDNDKIVEVWQPIWSLRFVEKAVSITEDTGTIKRILQQSFKSNLGNIDWRDVPLVDIEE